MSRAADKSPLTGCFPECSNEAIHVQPKGSMPFVQLVQNSLDEGGMKF